MYGAGLVCGAYMTKVSPALPLQRAELGLTLVESGFIATMFNVMGGLVGMLATLPAILVMVLGVMSTAAGLEQLDEDEGVVLRRVVVGGDGSRHHEIVGSQRRGLGMGRAPAETQRGEHDRKTKFAKTKFARENGHS